MILTGFLNKRAALVLKMGVALLLFGCSGEAGRFLTPERILQSERPTKGAQLFQEALSKARSGSYAEAIKLLREALLTSPDPAILPDIKYHLGRLLARTGAYRNSIKVLEDWDEKFAGHPLRGQVLNLIASNYLALGDLPQAFQWLVKLRDHQETAAPHQVEDTEEKIESIINGMGTKELEQTVNIASGTDYAPVIHYRLYHLYKEGGDLVKAREMAMALVRSTDDQYWVSVGRGLLEELSWLLFADKNKIGCLLPLSGPFAIYGQEVLRGIEMGLGLYQNQGPAASLELVLEDTEAKEETVEGAMRRLVQEEKVIAIIGPLRGVVAEAAAREAEAQGVPLIVISQRPGITKMGRMVFRNFLTPDAEVGGLVKLAVEELGVKRGAILYPDTGYGQTLAGLFEAELTKMGGKVVVKESYDPKQTDFAEQIKKMALIGGPREKGLLEQLSLTRSPEEEEARVMPSKTDPIIDFDAIFIPDHYERIAMIVPQLIYHEVRGPIILGTSTWQSEKLLDLAGEYLEGALIPSGFFPGANRQSTKDFVEGYKEAFGALPSVLAACGCDTIGILKEILSKDAVETRKELQQALLNHPGFDGVSGLVKFDGSGELARGPLLLTVSRGRFVPF